MTMMINSNYTSAEEDVSRYNFSIQEPAFEKNKMKIMKQSMTVFDRKN